jgi:hypothetical protein
LDFPDEFLEFFCVTLEASGGHRLCDQAGQGRYVPQQLGFPRCADVGVFRLAVVSYGQDASMVSLSGGGRSIHMTFSDSTCGTVETRCLIEVAR